MTTTSKNCVTKIKPSNAIILAAGFGSRAVPLTFEKPKALIEINGIPLIERQIIQLREKGISDIIVVIGHFKESFDYLVEKFDVKLVYNPGFAIKRNLSSLYLVREYLGNSYVILSDLMIEKNIFNEEECHSWMGCIRYSDEQNRWNVTTDNTMKITSIDVATKDTASEDSSDSISEQNTGNSEDGSLAIAGPAFLTQELSELLKTYLEEYYNREGSEELHWEEIIKDKISELEIYANDQTGNICEFERLEDIRKYDNIYFNNSGSEIMQYLANIHKVTEDKIVNIIPLTSGMTNQSMIYQIDDVKYVFRLPGVGTDKLIDRSCEKRTYDFLEPYDLTDEIVHFDTQSGRKISIYYDGARIMDPFNDDDFELSMKQTRALHDLAINVEYRFDMPGKISFYQSICDEVDAIRFSDIEETKLKVVELLAFREKLAIPEILCHGDTVFTNILLLQNGDCRIIDWEYCGAGDPIMDVAMYDIYAYYDREHVDRSLELYLGRTPTKQEKARLYMYVALGGYLWALWTEFKEYYGDNFGDYSLTMYNYLKDYYDILKNENLLE